MKSFVCVLLFFFISLDSYGQDIHFSEFYASPINLNPALTGQFDGSLRAGMGYRDQYRAVASPYQTLSVFADFRENGMNGRKNSFGYGLILNADIAGDAGMGTYQVGLPFALHFALTSTDILSLGAVPSLNILTVRSEDLRYGDQFGGFMYNIESVSAETGNLGSPLYFSLAAGINYTKRISTRATASAGVSAYNINSPNQSLYENTTTELPRRFAFHGLYRFAIGDAMDIVPLAKFAMQSTHRQLMFGGQIYQYLPQLSVRSINYGISFRALDYDAVIANFGFVYYLFYVGFNYDFNVSKLSAVSNSRGAFEMHIILYFDKSKFQKKRQSVSCPANF